MNVCSVIGCDQTAHFNGRCLSHHREWNAARLREYRGRSPEKHAAYMREYRKANPEAHKGYDLKKNFGISLRDYAAMLEAQGGVCAICSQPETVIDNRTKRPRNLAVDHDHDTDEVRGLLCMGCNQGIGNFREDAESLLRAASYLKRHVKEKVA